MIIIMSGEYPSEVDTDCIMFVAEEGFRRRAEAAGPGAARVQRAPSRGMATAGGWRSRDSTASRRAAECGSDRALNYNGRGCNKCGMMHNKNACPAYGRQCLRCSHMNHFSRMCGVYQIEESDQQIIYCLNNEIS